MLSRSEIWWYLPLSFLGECGESSLSLWFFCYLQVIKNWIYFQQNSTEGDIDEFADTYNEVAESWEDSLHI